LFVGVVGFGEFGYSLLKCSDVRRAVLLGRMKQNLRICKKYKVKIRVFSFALKPYEIRSEKDLESLGKVLVNM
jgi:RNase P/RNase MRP subunit p30